MDGNEQQQQQVSLHPCEWIMGKMIGSGSFGTVHLAMRKDTGSFFVIKYGQGKAPITALENEADILESLDSPYVVHCLGRNVLRGKDGGKKLCIFMEYMAGGNLSDVAEKFGGKLDEEIIRLYTREILHGLRYLHRNRIVHGDLKCKNVLLGSDGDIKLADFGCAKKLDDSKCQRVSRISGACIGGTPLWMAPEILRNEDLNTCADIWSLGCTMIEMATGRPPWCGNVSSPEAALMKIANSNELPTFPKGFSADGTDFLTKCFQRVPRKRSTAEELLMHPFIMGHFKKETVDSPSSVLMLELDTEDSDIDDSEFNQDYELPQKNPFSAKCHQEGETVEKRKQMDNDFFSSGSWINVRQM